jgi:PAS domain S-box-containing protein
MPEMNGYEVCEHLKADDKLKGIPVIFISALTEQLDKVKAFAIGGVDYLTRPFQMEELHARVETHLKLRRLQIELEYEIQQRTIALRKSQEQLAAILHTAADAIITINATGIIQSVNAATERMFGYTAAETIGQNVKMLMPSPYLEEHDRYLDSYNKTGVKKIIGIGLEVVARRKDGSTLPVDLAVSAVDHLKLFTGILRDVSRRQELEREVLEIASLEQRRIGQDLHDSVGQELTALNILAGDLAETLATDPSNGSKLVERIVQGLRRSQNELRTVMRGLLPVAVDTEGLMAALSDLADRIQQEGKATCKFDCPEPVSVADNLNATHLFLIAQEAVHNAAKHAQPKNIRISLKSDDLLVLNVQDDGVGMPTQPTENHGGLGLRIMRNRAAIIGARLTIQPAEPTGTLVMCALIRKNHETKPD